MENMSQSLLLLEKTTEQGMTAITVYLKKHIKKPFFIIDHWGKYHYKPNLFAENPVSLSCPTNENLTKNTFYQADNKRLIYKVGKHDFYLFIMINSVTKEEINAIQDLLKNTRLSLLFCLNTMSESQANFSKIENDLMEILFVKKIQNFNDFLPFGHFNLNSDKPYVIQLIHLDKMDNFLRIHDVIDHLAEYTEKNKLPSMRAIYWQNNLVHIIPALYTSDTFEILEEWPEVRVSETFRKSAEQKFNIKISIGIGQVYPLCELYKSYKEAQIALLFNYQSNHSGYVQRFCDLGIFRHIFSQDINITKNYVLHKLGPILDYDNQKQSNLLSTLQILTSNGFNWKETAANCKVHVNTIYYRMERIEKILQTKLNTAESKFDLFVTLKLWDVLSLLEIIDDDYVGSIGNLEDTLLN